MITHYRLIEPAAVKYYERECLNDFKSQRQNEENELEKIRNEIFKKKVAELN